MVEETQPFASVDAPSANSATNQREQSTQVPAPSAETDATQTFAAARNDDTDNASSQACGRFQIVRPHAQGGLGEVYVAQDEELRRRVALKRIRARFIDDEESRLRFLREAEITGNLEHPGIVPIYGLGLDESGRPYYAMRFIEGETLRDAVRRHHASQSPVEQRRAELRKLLRRFLDVCNAIDYAHSRGVIHRDLKPANIMLGKHGETLVVDWGLAKALSTDDGTAPVVDGANDDGPLTGSDMQTQLGAAMGTPQFMSPEQAAGRHDELTPATDVYALGAVLYDLITGKSIPERLANVQAGKIAPPRTVRRDVPPPLASICLHALAMRPADRYPTARALADDIERWLADERVSVHRESSTEQLIRWSRTHRTAVASVAALTLTTVVGLVIGLLVVRGEQRETDRQRQAAELARNQESEQRKLAEHRQLEAESAQAKEAAERKRADAARDHADRTAYTAHLQAADASWDSNHVAAAWDHLRAAPPQFRGWEHDYLVTKFTRDLVMFRANKAYVTTLECSADGTRLMTSGGIGELRVWNVADRRELVWVRSGIGRPNVAAFRSDGKRMAAVREDGLIQIWDAETGAELNSFVGSDRGLTDIINMWFSPDGGSLVTASSKTLRTWDTATGREIAKIERPNFYPARGGYRADGEQFASIYKQTQVILWDLTKGEPTGALSPAPAHINRVVYSPDGAYVAAACTDGTIKVWDAVTRREVNGLHGFAGSAEAPAFSRDGKRIAAGGRDATIRVWDVVTGRQLAVFRGHLSPPESVTFTPDGNHVISGDRDGMVLIWDLVGGPKSSFFGGATNPLHAPTLCHDGTRLAAVNAAKEIVIWDAGTGNLLHKSPHVEHYIGRLVFSPDDTLLAVAGQDMPIRVLDTTSGDEVRRLEGFDKNVSAVAFSADGRRLAAGSQNNQVRVWDLATGRETLPPLKLADYPHHLTFDEAGNRLIAVSGIRRDVVTVWNVHDGALEATWKGPHALGYHRAAGRGQFLSVLNKTVFRFDVATGKEEKRFDHDVTLRSVAISPDGRLAAGSEFVKKDIVLWDVESGRILHRLRGHVDGVTCLAFNADGTRLVSGGDDRMVKIWDTAGGLELLTLRDHDFGINRLEFARDGKRIVGYAQQGTVVVWDASRSEPAPATNKN